MLIADTWKDIYQYFDWISQYEPWDDIGEREPIVIERPGKRPVYVRIIGFECEQCGIGIYFTEEDYLAANAGEQYLWCEDEHYVCQQNAIIGFWGDEEFVSRYNQNILTELDIREDENGLLPHFDKYEYGYAPMKIKTNDSAELADILKHTYQAVSFLYDKVPDLEIPEGKVLLRYYDDQKRRWITCLGEHPILQAEQDFYWEVTDPRISELQTMKAKGSWTVIMDMIPDMLMDHKKGLPYFPTSIIVYNNTEKEGKKLFEEMFTPVEIVEQGVLWGVLYDLCSRFGKPEEIVVTEEVMNCRMVDFCQKAGIRLANKTEEALAQLNRFVAENKDELDAYFSKLQEEEQDPDAEQYNEFSCVISVSLGTGLYRHILISAAATLEDLHKAILDAFGFSDDHLHMFCLTPTGSTVRMRYYSKYADGERMTTDQYMLGQVLEEGQKFRYVFDFGDNWEFTGKVLRINDEPCGKPMVIRSKGEAPQQYPDGEGI